MADLFSEILQARKIALLARVATELEFDNEENRFFLSLIHDLSSELLSELYSKELEIKSLLNRGV